MTELPKHGRMQYIHKKITYNVRVPKLVIIFTTNLNIDAGFNMKLCRWFGEDENRLMWEIKSASYIIGHSILVYKEVYMQEHVHIYLYWDCLVHFSVSLYIYTHCSPQTRRDQRYIFCRIKLFELRIFFLQDWLPKLSQIN